MWKCVVLALCALAIAVNCAEEWRHVNIVQGPVRGRIDPDGGLYNFYNIPYATAPTGKDRFKAPLPPPVWLTTFDAVDREILCPQYNVRLNMQEDCLVANVFAPDTDETNLPVVVIIHGGAYQTGFGNSQMFKNLARKEKVILVSFNYRLGVHGFLCLGTEGAPGNAGLKDQVALLRWVKTSISSFGGNPEDVTLLSCSAGGGSADMLTLSSITTGLFQKAMIGSGASTGAVGVQIDPVENAKYYARLLGFTNVDDMESLEEFYQSATFQQLTSRHDVITSNENASILFSPCVERDIGQERVISDTPMNVIKSGKYNKIPLLYGYANMEGLMRNSMFDTWKDRMNEKFSDFIPAELHFESEAEKEAVAQTVKQYYFGDKLVGKDTMLEYIDFFTDVLFGYPMLHLLTARLESLGDTIYLYEYSFVDEDTPVIPNTAGLRGANHCDQTQVMSDQADRRHEFNQMSSIIGKYFVNFIFTGSPAANDTSLVAWPPANAKRAPYMMLEQPAQLRTDVLGGRDLFWDPIYEKYYRGPVMPAATGGTASITVSKVIFAVVVLLYRINL